MGLADRLKDLKTKAEDTAVEHSGQLHSAVEKATAVADQRTGGRYSERIHKAGAKAGELVDSLKDSDAPAGADSDAPAGADSDAHAGADSDAHAGAGGEAHAGAGGEAHAGAGGEAPAASDSVDR